MRGELALCVPRQSAALEHRAGLVGIDERLTMDDCVLPERRDHLVAALEQQRPAWCSA